MFTIAPQVLHRGVTTQQVSGWQEQVLNIVDNENV